MLVSVVIPTYNRALLVERAVRSVLSQSWTELEVLVVDDGSVDDTRERLWKLDDTRMRIIRKENGGVSSARNEGLRAAQGEILALLDSDDWWRPDKLSRQVDFMLRGGFAVCQTDEIWIRRGKRVNPGKKHAKPSGRFFEKALEQCLVSPSCVAFTRSFWEDVGPFDEELPACEDYDLWLRTCLRHEVGLLPEKLTVKEGGRPDQLSRKIIGLDLYRIQALLKLLRTEKMTADQRRATLSALERKAGVYVRGCLKRDKPEEAGRIAALASYAREEAGFLSHPV